MEGERVLFEAGNDDLGCQIIATHGEGRITISNNDDWCGDSISGFGATVSVELSREDVSRLQEFLNIWLEATP